MLFFKYHRLLPLSLLAVFLPLVARLPQYSDVWIALNNSAHAVLFMGLAIVAATLLRLTVIKDIRVAYVVLALLTLGAMIEYIQGFIGRSRSLHDWGLDALGIAAGLCVYWAWSGRQALWLLGAGICLAWAFSLPTLLIWQRIKLQQQLPLLCDFDSACPAWGASGGAEVRKTSAPLWKANNSHVIELRYGATKAYPGVSFTYVTSRWRLDQKLCLDAYWPYLEPSLLGVHIHDATFARSHRKFDSPYVLASGENKLCIPISDVAAKINLTSWRELILYVPKPVKAGEVYVDNLRLE